MKQFLTAVCLTAVCIFGITGCSTHDSYYGGRGWAPAHGNIFISHR